MVKSGDDRSRPWLTQAPSQAYPPPEPEGQTYRKSHTPGHVTRQESSSEMAGIADSLSSRVARAEVEIDKIKSELSYRAQLISVHETRLSLLEKSAAEESSRLFGFLNELRAVGDRISKLDLEERRSWVAPFRPHAWKILIGVGIMAMARLITGEWPDPISVLTKIQTGLIGALLR